MEQIIQILRILIPILSALVGLVVTLMYLYQVVYLFVPFFLQRKRERGPYPHKRYAILIAARNEEAVIGHLLDSIQAQDYPAQCITTYVVADNCTDQTAAIARAHGAVVFERFNQEQVGKGYALEYLLNEISTQAGWDQHDCFLIFDADNVLSSSYVTQINKLAAQGYQVFSGYRNAKNFGTSWISAGHSLWYIHDSVHLNYSRMLLGVGCMVTGTGYGYTREVLEKMGGWPFHCLTEDIEFSTWCAANKIKIGYAPNAILYDEQPISLKVSVKQRTRWAQGGIQVSLKYFAHYFKTILHGGWSAWTGFEALTLSLWGYGLAAICAVLSIVSSVCVLGIWGIPLSLVSFLLGTYCSMFLIGALTLWTEWNKIYATTGQKLMALFTYPIYVASYVPIAGTAIFRKFQWTPIEHKVSVSAESLQQIK